jgi:hypothetical protein
VPGDYDPEGRTFYYDSDVLGGTPLMIGDFVTLRNQVSSDEENGTYVVTSVSSSREHGGTQMKRLSEKNDTPDVANVIMGDDEGGEDYFCVTNPSVKFRHECLASTDVYGNPKPMVDVWDAPCTNGSQCPFFHYDAVAGQYRGRCVSGYCEMPQGYTRVGFRKYINQ